MDTFGNKNYLKEMTNAIPWHRVLETVLSVFYLIIWCLMLAWFWKGGKEEIQGFNNLVFVFILPVMTIAMSFYFGISKNFGIYRWIMVAFFAIMYLLMNYFTYDLVVMMAKHTIMLPDWHLLIAPAVYSVGGMFVGALVRWILALVKKHKREAANG